MERPYTHLVRTTLLYRTSANTATAWSVMRLGDVELIRSGQELNRCARVRRTHDFGHSY